MKLPKFLVSKKYIIAALVILIVGFLGLIYILAFRPSEDTENTILQEPSASQEAKAPEQQTEDQGHSNDETVVEQPKINNSQKTTSKWPVQLSVAQAGSLKVVVNKKYKLPSSYVPSLTSTGGGQLRPEAAIAYKSLIDGAKKAGINLVFLSGYRSYSYQSTLYNNYVARDGQAAADTYSARPGHSEHQTGLTVDVGDGGGCDLEACFGDRTAGKWVAANAYKYGFILRYPKGEESITGYTLRYVGNAIAADIFASGKVLEEYYGVEGGGY